MVLWLANASAHAWAPARFSDEDQTDDHSQTRVWGLHLTGGDRKVASPRAVGPAAFEARRGCCRHSETSAWSRAAAW